MAKVLKSRHLTVEEQNNIIKQLDKVFDKGATKYGSRTFLNKENDYMMDRKYWLHAIFHLLKHNKWDRETKILNYNHALCNIVIKLTQMYYGLGKIPKWVKRTKKGEYIK